jgi:hypothetical protein
MPVLRAGITVSRQKLMRTHAVFLLSTLAGLLVLAFAQTAEAITCVVVNDFNGAAGRVGAPVSAEVDLTKMLDAGSGVARLQLTEVGASTDQSLPAQFEPSLRSEGHGKLWWFMPPGPQGERRFQLTVAKETKAAALVVRFDSTGEAIDVLEDDQSVLRYNHGTVPVRDGVGANYSRGDYISPLFGPTGEELTEDYPSDHPHHRGVSWSWPVVRWGDEVRDIWAVRGIWARPVEIRSAVAGPVVAIIDAESVWKWADEQAIVAERVIIRAFRRNDRGRFVDVDVRLTALTDGIAIGGRPKAGYGGFGLRAAPCENRKIVLHREPSAAGPVHAWLDYSGEFGGGKGRAGVTILEHIANSDYPSQLHEYPDCNYVMPAYPGAREVPLPEGKTLLLRHRLWIHRDAADEKTLRDVWTSYAMPPQVNLAK